MQRMKKPLVWLVLLTLIVSWFPAGLVQKVSAAPGDYTTTTYFSPDDRSVGNTIKVGGLLDKENLREDVFITSSPTISINGSYSKVSGDGLKAQIDLLNWNTTVKQWVPDKVHSVPGTVQKDTSAPESRFTAANLTLYPGLNRITFTGKLGNQEGSESFYVLYDKVPYVSKLSVSGGGLLNAINLNEGTRVVVEGARISLIGEVYNTTKATVSVNGGTPLSTDIYNNQLATPPLVLSPGLNKLQIVFKNSSDSLTINRDIYYFSQAQPFTDMYVMESAKEHNLINNNPTLTQLGMTSAPLIIQAILPYYATPFETDSEITINGQTVTISRMLNSNLKDDKQVFIPTAGSEVEIPGSNGLPAYRLVTFETTPFQFATDPLTGNVNTKQSPQVTIKYGKDSGVWKFTANYDAKFNYLAGKTVITDMKYLPEYSTSNTDLTNQTQLPLNGATVSSSEFYILVKSDGVPSGALIAEYLPIGTKRLKIETTSDSNVYKITGFSNGEQEVRFNFEDASAPNAASSPYIAKITYVSKNFISVDNWYDGQTYTFNSKTSPDRAKFIITGEYIGFENISNAEYFVNGTKNNLTLNANKFNETLQIDGKLGPLVFGENTIVFTGTSMDNAGNKRVVTKTLRIYINDENVSSIQKFAPGKVPDEQQTRAKFPTTTEFDSPVTDAKDKAIASIFTLPTEFTYESDKYTTSEQQYDLLVRGSGVRTVNVLFGSEKIYTKTFTATTEIDSSLSGTVSNEPGKLYEVIGNENDFILRIMNLKFELPGTHIYTLELINDTGARTTQRLEITRQLAPYRIIAPQPTVDGKYVVNKNFLHFDIEAEGATKVIIDKAEATRSTVKGEEDRFIYDYVGLKPDKSNKVKIQIVRPGSTINDSIDVFYTGTVTIDSQYMAPKVTNKYSIFNKQLELNFPKGTVMQSAVMNDNRITKFYPDTKLLFAVADPIGGIVERRNDYGGIINRAGEYNTITIPDSYLMRFNSTESTYNFTRVSDIYWISAGLGELGDKGNTSKPYLAASNGITPYSYLGAESFFTNVDKVRKLVPSKRGTLKLSYDSNLVDEAGSLITVFRYTDVGGYGKWERIPGTVDTKKRTVTVPFDEFGYYTIMKMNKGFSDITNHPWARNILNALYSKGIMENLRVDTFGADDQTTRGEFATLLVKGLSLPITADEQQQTFFDVPYASQTATWDFDHIETAARAGIITGRTEGFFSPNMPITRQEAAVMISRALKLKLPANDSKLQATLSKSFLDSGKIEYYARPAVQAVSGAKIMSGDAITVAGAKKPSYNFNPTSNLTRAEAGKIAVELLKKSTDIFPKNFN
ncbi:S-layer homology domain-containing protein [Paenibacillus sp. IHBB 10380]|uniref:S-layer homology domain-containing protein n=1 Tax=Paenibacillus sp. IHBB 10380 TaxID=1566358 RepID=UPI0005CF9A68|nr:S-layer homology domain-containing protein [Paenibacillus sp. IHBB 10380]AJS60387.1 hypothetical protein UB51_20215 [Paenibacillus sp. IHBB 10380]